MVVIAFITLATILGVGLHILKDMQPYSPAPSSIETTELSYKVHQIRNGDIVLVAPGDNRLLKMEDAFYHNLDVNVGDTVILYVDKYNHDVIIDMEGNVHETKN